MISLQIVPEQKFECTFGTTCEGNCCRSRPHVLPEDIQAIESVLHRAIPLMRSEAQDLVIDKGYLSALKVEGHPTLRTINYSLCVFFNKGCVLHKLGALEGDPFLYKPVRCILFPIGRNDDGSYGLVRKPAEADPDLFPCLTQAEGSDKTTSQSLKAEFAMIEQIENGTHPRFKAMRSELVCQAK